VSKTELLNLLRTALEDAARRPNVICRFQKAIFDGNQSSLGLSSGEWDVMSQLALDLDYYESDPEWRREDASYYGDERLTEEIREAMGKLHAQA
jgi:hypothetical protein